MKTILVIDDEPSMLTTISHVLKNAGFEALTAHSGEAGLRLAYERLPDLIVCDVNLPDLNGTTVLQALREDPATADRQIVLMTGQAEDTFAQRTAMDIGADDFLHKPFTPSELLSCIQARFRRTDLNQHVAGRTYDHLRQTLHSTLPHEFFAPIASILGIVDMLKQEQPHNSETVNGLYTDIERHAKKLHRSFDNYMKLMDLESGSEHPPKVFLPADSAWQTIEGTGTSTASAKDRGPDFQLEGEACSIPLSENHLATIVEELVDNACTYSRKGSPIKVKLYQDAHFVRLEVRDQGRGMSTAQLKELKESILPQKGSTTAPPLPHGLGILIAHKLAESHGGGLQIQSTPSVGSIFTAFWPLKK